MKKATKRTRKMTMYEFEKKYGIHFTRNHTGKMQHLVSLSTSVLCNPYCEIRRSIDGMVCAVCYAANMTEKLYKQMQPLLEENTKVLTTVLIPKKDMPFLVSESGYFRFEAFGDLINEIQVANYFNMAAANPHMHCALWTKNPWIIRKAIATYNLKKPRNLAIIGSAYYLNTPMAYEAFPFIDKVFTVYTRKYIRETGIEINCGSRDCAGCGRCYENYGGREVNEQKK